MYCIKYKSGPGFPPFPDFQIAGTNHLPKAGNAGLQILVYTCSRGE